MAEALEHLDPILRTKLHRPPVPEDFVCRDRLHEQMNLGLTTPLTLVSAPAGYGKSTLVSDWIESLDHPCSWVSLDDPESDIQLFLAYVLAAVQTAFPGSCEQTTELLGARDLAPVPVLARSLANDLNTLDTDFVLALEDYHRIAPDSDVHGLIRGILEHPPEPLHLVVVTRYDPPFPTASLRAGRSITEVRLRDLQFTESEISGFLERSSNLNVSEDALSNLHHQTGGWAVAIRLVALHLRHLDDPDGFMKNLRGGTQHIQEYLLQEVIAHRSSQMQDWMVKTSILDRFCSELCEAVCTIDDTAKASNLDGRQFLDALQRCNLFVIPQDARGKWFRFHHLFQELLGEELKQRQDPEEIVALRLRAVKWFEREGLIDEALAHALAVGDHERATQIVERSWRDAVNQGRWHPLKNWLHTLPRAMVQERLELLVAHASIHYYYLDIALIPPILDRIDNLICGDQEKRIYSGEIEMFRGMCSFFQSEGARSLECFELALESLPETHVEYRVITEVFFGLAGQMSGQGERVSRVLTDWLGEPAEPHPRRTAMLMLTLAIMSYISGDTEEAEHYLERHRRFADTYGLEVSQAWTDYLISLIHLQRGNIQAAIPSLEEAASRRYIHYTRAAADALAALTLAYQANGQPEQAVATLQSLEEFATHLGPPLPALAASCAARLELMQGHPESAARWFGTSISPPVEAMILWLENPCVTWCRALIAEESGARVGEAEKRLRELAEICEANHNTCQLISILCLLAVACDKRGTTEEALAVLVRALELARSGNFVFPFLELGQPMADLLRKLPEQDANAVYVERILSNFAESEKEPAAEAARPPVSQTLVDPLTSRELDVVELLRKRLRDKEIAAQLFISTQTVNSHLKSVYQKLGVSNRHQAAAKASELGLLSAD